MKRITLFSILCLTERKIKYTDYFKGVGFRSNVYSRAKIISEISKQNMEKLPQKEKNSALTSGMADGKTLQIIDELSYQLIQ
jgi:SNF2 family DNA or RNA helicase